MKRFNQFFSRLFHDSHGVALIEYVFVLPVLLALFFSVMEVSRAVRFQQKMDFTIASVADAINQMQNVGCGDLQQLNNALPLLMKPFNNSTRALIITAVQCDNNCTTPYARWQVTYGGGYASKIAPNEGAPASIPRLTMRDKDQSLTVELYAIYTPYLDNSTVRELLGIDPSGVVYKQVVARPRYGAFQFSPRDVPVVGAGGC